MTNKEIIFDIQTGETTEKPLSKEIIDFHKKINDKIAAVQAEAEAKAAARQAIADRLGLTADELQVLLG